jgi:hybrid polyketide synthase / nonribosomal peptide synthetase ACE1
VDGCVSYRHHVGDQIISMDKFRKFLEEQSESERGGRSFKTVPLVEWTARAQAAGLHPLLAAFFENLSRENRVFSFPRFVKGD